ncbi:uncharacterized protein TM35_000064250 [Trypanosoma theileri]|uniref:Uncharacterized protein n=1 Tax=Trypanosoma theileri TaxID=67003 RepID=A0A1X0P4P6_9TRYP|nr:uncharacterized protein TM35_000064250 [Trypanosoma theileri]ORC91420.1 hypothetical protein TM35_000064250 [Trypanosoma theileri]
MSVDPLMALNDDHRELQRLLKENRELRNANASLRVAVESKRVCSNCKGKTSVSASSSTSAAAAAGGVGTLEGGKEEAGHSSETNSKSSGNSVSLKKMKEELQRTKEELERTQQGERQVSEEYKQLKSLFESFVVEVCEREEAYKLAFLRAYEKIEEQKSLAESLQRQLEERPPPTLISETPVTPTPPLPLPASSSPPVVNGLDPSSLHDLVDTLRTSLSELEFRLGFNADTSNRQIAPVAVSRATRGKGRSAKSVHSSQMENSTHNPQLTENEPQRELQSLTSTTPTPTPTLLPPQPMKREGNQYQESQNKSQENLNKPSVVEPARGAGVLRSSTLSSSHSTTTERKKRVRKTRGETETVKRQAVEGPSESSAASLFKGFTRTTEAPKLSVVNFGTEPIADYLALLEKTDTHGIDILRRELIKFCASNLNILASYAVEHFLSKSSLLASAVTLWKHTERVMHISKGVFEAFIKEAVRKMVHLLSPEGTEPVDHSSQLRCLALVVRMACAVQLRETDQGEEALFVAFYECTVSTLRAWRLGTLVSGQQHVLGPWMLTVRHLCGFVEDFHMVMHYYANLEHVLNALTIPKSLTRYTIQAVMSLCYFTSSSESLTPSVGKSGDIETWMSFCDAMDWSYNELPLDMIVSAAARLLAQSNDAYKHGEALLSLRLLVLQKGFGLLQPLMEELRSSGGEVDVDAAFAELFSLAVIDLQLEDPRDEQWCRAMAFFSDYLSTCSVERVKSAEELIAACKDTHLLVLRAVLQLCHGANAVTEKSVVHLTNILSWAKALQIVLARSSRENENAIVTHPLRKTVLGRQLLYLSQQEL